MERSTQPTCIGNVLAQCQLSVDVKSFAFGIENREVGILLDETIRLGLESLYCLVIPPICVVAILVIVTST